MNYFIEILRDKWQAIDDYIMSLMARALGQPYPRQNPEDKPIDGYMYPNPRVNIGGDDPSDGPDDN